ncbi:MAG: endopeptidase La [Deltaproteobacteria bacterium]|nr:endopeptidase La [Deltaproteobacteria bacterium]MBW2106384.1 endopeptidase La [Deltaproteobacteria bacterium]MBW2332659.1 endopeptidase La [Deltaproteobacteria bacterium]
MFKKNSIENFLGKENKQVPLLPLRDIVVFPGMVIPLFIGREKSINALKYALSQEKEIFLSTQKNAKMDKPTLRDIYSYGTLGIVLQLLKMPDGTVKSLVEGKSRAKIKNYLPDAGFFMVEVEKISEHYEPNTKTEALIRSIHSSFESYTKLNQKIGEDVAETVTSINNPSQLVNTVAAHLTAKIKEKQSLLEIEDVNNRLEVLYRLLNAEIDILKLEESLRQRVKKQMEKTQKNYYLNEQMRAIQKEMGTQDDFASELKDLERKIKNKNLPKEAATKVRHEFKKLKMMTPMSAEATVVRNYIDWILSLPWLTRTKDKLNIQEAEAILEEDHYGLSKPKERILEYLAVQNLTKKIKGPILCFVGPPGVGKTSLAKSVARSMGRNFIRLSLGGVRDEAEIRGHRRTYIGAMPGKIIQYLKRAKSNNPVFCLDEVDKMSTDFRGDPSAALLEVLDPEQNYAFNDHYLDIDYNLSEVFFITTANELIGIPPPLQDRMEIIRLPGYTEIEKLHIAKRFLIKKQIEQNGLSEDNISFSDRAILNIIRYYTREAGVRNLEREIASVCRKIAREVAKKGISTKIMISANSLHHYLGVVKFHYDRKEEKDEIGLATGLAWTSAGGELLHIETTVMPGKGELVLTGTLGDVMKESAKAALSYVRTKGRRLGLPDDFYEKVDIHVHIPEGATPKDGPSAGITVATSIASALLRKSVKRNLAMTGEITLRGRILPIGGLKEKIIAAHRGGIEQVLIPQENKKDIEEIPARVLKKVELILVEHMDDVLEKALTLVKGEDLFLPEDRFQPFTLPKGEAKSQITAH